MQKNLDLTASKWPSPEVRRERDTQRSTWTSRNASPQRQDPPSIRRPWQSQSSATNTIPPITPLTSDQRQYVSRQKDLQRFRKLFQRLAWKANSLTHWSHRALNLAQEHQAFLQQQQQQQHHLPHGHIHGHHYFGTDHSARAILGSYEMLIDPIEAERQFKIDFYEFYALLERSLVCLLGVWGILITATAGVAPTMSSGPTPEASLSNTVKKTIIGDSISFHGSAHRFHANVLAALEHPSNPLYSTLGSGPVSSYIGIAKEFRNKWKDVESRPEEAFHGHERAEEEWDPRKMKRYEKVLQDLKLEELLGSVLSGLEEAGRKAEQEIQRLESLLGNQGRRVVGDVDFDMQDAPFEVMGEQGGYDYEMKI